MPDVLAILKKVPASVWCLFAMLPALKLFLLWRNSPKRKRIADEKRTAKFLSNDIGRLSKYLTRLDLKFSTIQQLVPAADQSTFRDLM